MATIAQSPFSPKAKGEGFRDIPIADSSFLQNFKYDADSQQLTVTMKSGGQYLYSNVPQMVIEQLVKAPSKGRFFAEGIKGKFESSSLVPKTIGPPVRNPLKGPVTHERRFTKQIARTKY